MLITKKLSEHIPVEALPIIQYYFDKYNFKLTITRDRRTKLGDYRPPRGQHGHRISVNGTLNQYSFLVTLIHEIAHLITWEQYNNRVKSHGSEWKGIFKIIMHYFLKKKVFPEDLRMILRQHIENPPAASCRDVKLIKALRKYDAKSSDKILLEEINEGVEFVYSENRVFKKLKKLRKRYQCIEVASQKIYLFSPIAEVEIVN